MWFAESAVGVGRITMSGVLTDFGRGHFHAYDITVGSDGRLWFTGRKQGCSISTAGAFGPLFGDPKSHSGKMGRIAAGADGALWMSIGRYERILWVTTSIHEHVFRHIPTQAYDITAGPDANLWFTDGESIWRMTDAPTPATRVSPRRARRRADSMSQGRCSGRSSRSTCSLSTGAAPYSISAGREPMRWAISARRRPFQRARSMGRRVSS